MSAVLTRPAPEGDIIDPVKEDGSRYRYEMLFEQGRTRAYADSAADLLGVFVDGYADLAVEERVRARIEYAASLLAPMQATILHGSDQTDLSDEDRAVILQPRHEPVVVEEWSSAVPLVLLDVHYIPFSEVPAPVSTLEDVANPANLVWLRPSDEYEFLMSLHRVGTISLGENPDFTV